MMRICLLTRSDGQVLTLSLEDLSKWTKFLSKTTISVCRTMASNKWSKLTLCNNNNRYRLSSSNSSLRVSQCPVWPNKLNLLLPTIIIISSSSNSNSRRRRLRIRGWSQWSTGAILLLDWSFSLALQSSFFFKSSCKPNTQRIIHNLGSFKIALHSPMEYCWTPVSQSVTSFFHSFLSPSWLQHTKSSILASRVSFGGSESAWCSTVFY